MSRTSPRRSPAGRRHLGQHAAAVEHRHLPAPRRSDAHGCRRWRRNVQPGRRTVAALTAASGCGMSASEPNSAPRSPVTPRAFSAWTSAPTGRNSSRGAKITRCGSGQCPRRPRRRCAKTHSQHEPPAVERLGLACDRLHQGLPDSAGVRLCRMDADRHERSMTTRGVSRRRFVC